MRVNKYMREVNNFKNSYQSYFCILMMKLALFFIVFLRNIMFLHSFITYPFNAKSLLDEFLTIVSHSYEKIENNVMENAIPGELCNRGCQSDDFRVCHFKFRIKFYQILSG